MIYYSTEAQENKIYFLYYKSFNKPTWEKPAQVFCSSASRYWMTSSVVYYNNAQLTTNVNPLMNYYYCVM